ncbi:MAG: polysaccharide lyase [Verrucomicrobiota bacterium]
MRVLAIFVSVSWLAAQILGEDLPFIAVDFESIETGEIGPELVEDIFGSLRWERLSGRARVIEKGSGQVLEVVFPKGQVGSEESGSQFVVKLPEQRKMRLRYRVRPEKGFDFVKGGKLPGLSSGGSQFTGGRPPGSSGGWSARYMWRREGALELYFYHPEMKGKFGERHSLGVKLEPGRWSELIQEIDTGNPGEGDGSLRIWIDGEIRLELEELELHGTEYGRVDSFLFHTFYGGSDRSWAPSRETRLQFDDFEISTSPVEER